MLPPAGEGHLTLILVIRKEGKWERLKNHPGIKKVGLLSYLKCRNHEIISETSLGFEKTKARKRPGLGRFRPQ